MDGLTGGAYTSHDSVGYLGQAGSYTDPETAPLGTGGLLAVGGSYYDVKQGHYVTRGEDINGYKASDNNPLSYVDWLGVAQSTIDTVGLIPVLNIPTSLASAGFSAYKGDLGGVALSVAAVIPFEGEGDAVLKLARDAKSLSKELVIEGAKGEDVAKTAESGVK